MSTPRDLFDIGTQRDLIHSNVREAIQTKFPLENENYSLEVDEVDYKNPKSYTLKEQQDAIVQKRTLDNPIYGTWRLRDKATNQVLDEKRKVLARIPYLTRRGTYIYNGNEFSIANQQRLRPGIYAREKDNGELEAHAALMPGTGSSFRMFMEPTTGVFKVSVGQANIPAYPLLQALGAKDEDLKDKWGKEIFDINAAKGRAFDLKRVYSRMVNSSIQKKYGDDYAAGLRATFERMEIDPEIAQTNLGKAYKHINAEVLTRTAQKLLNISRGTEETDDRDSQLNQELLSPEDLFAERITKDSGQTIRKLLWKAANKKKLDFIPSGALSPQIRSVLLNSGLAAPTEQINPILMADQLTRVSRLGEGGMSAGAVPDSARNVQPSQFGLIDPVRGPECMTGDAEVLTKRGWVRWDQVEDQDEFACLIDYKPLGKNKVEYYPASKIIREYYEGPMYGVQWGQNHGPDYLVTPGHRVWAGSEHMQFEFITAEEAYKDRKRLTLLHEISTKENGQITKTYRIHPDGHYTVNHKGMVYCATVPGGLLYVRHNKDSAGHWTGNSGNIGVDTRATINTYKGRDGLLYKKVLDPRTNKTKLVNNRQLVQSVFAFPGEMESDRKKVRAMKDGKVQYVTREEVQYVLPSGQDMFSFTSNLVPLISGIKGGRLLMGSKIMNQALPLQAPEAPLVQAATADNPDQSFEELYGSQLMGAIRADQPGRVVSVNDDMMKVKYADGSTADVELYNNFTMNQKSQLHNTAMLKPGDEFKKGDLIAKSNFTDDNGTTAIGRNLRVAFLPYKGNYEDGIVISESAAKNLSSEHAYQVKFDPQDAGVEVGKKQFISRYPGKFNREQLDKIGDDGLVKPGTVLDEGDPMVLSTKTRKPTRGTAILKQQKNWTNDHSVVWDHHTPGIVTNVYGSDRSIKVMTKTYMPAERGDKLCFDAKTELMTNKGWVPVSEVGFNTRLATLNSTTGHLEYDNPTELHRIPNTRGEVPTFNVIDHVNYNSQTTMEHKHLVRLPGESAFALVPAKELINKTFEIKKTSKGLINKQVASISCPYIGENRRSNISYVALIMQLFKFRELISFKLFGRQLVLKTHLFPTDAAARILKTAGYADIKNKITANDRKLKISDSQLVSELKEIFANTADFMQQVLLTENYTLIRIFCTHALQSSLVHTYKQEMTLNGYTEQECSIMHAMCVATGLPSDLYTRINYGRNGEFLEQKILTIYPQDMQFIVNADPRENKHQTVIRPSESGSFYCVTVPNHIVMVRRGGTAYWSGNSNRYGGKGTIGAIYPDDQMPKDQNGQAFEAVLNPLGIISRCYDDQTEFLTRRGWLKGDTVESSDELVQWEPETGTLAYTEQIAPFYKSQYKGAMIGYQDMSADFMVTPNHKFMVKPHKATQEWTECTAEELLDMPLQRKVLAPVHGQMGDLGKYGEPVTYKGLTMDPILLCDLAGFLYRRVHFKTEGRDLVYAVKSGTDMFDKFMDWAQKHDSIKWRYDQLEEVVKFMDKEVHEFVREFDLTDFIKKVVLKAPRDARDIFFDSLVLYRPRVMVKESDVAALQHAAVLSNMTVYPKALTKEGMCEVRIGSPGTTSICRSNTPGFFEQDYDGMIYCPSVLSGYIVTRRNGKVLIAGNTNPSQMVETLLAKVARKTGKPYKLPAFSDKDMIEYALDELKNAGLEETELVEDPATNRQLKDIFTGEQFLMKLHHVSSSKLSERDTGSYSMDHTPSRGKFGGSKRMGTLETMSLVGHGATEVLKDARLVRGQKNDEYWQRYKMGMPVRTPRNSYMYDKFLDMLRASGVNVEREGSHINIMAMTDRDIMEISGDRALKSGDAINSKTQEPIKGGLFDLGLTGGKEGSRFARIDLDTPIPHPVMEEPIIRLLGMTKQKFRDAISDDSEFSQMQQKLAQMNVDDEIERNLAEIKSGKKSKRDLAVKRLKYLTGMKKAGIEPSELLINHIPVLPPKFRPIAKMNDMELTSDANLLYKDLFEANNLYRDLKGATDNSGEERVNLYDAAKAVVGLGDPINVKNKEKNVAGLLTHVFGKQGPKFGLVQRKLLGTTVDQVGRAVISPDNSLDIDQVGLPETAAWGIYRPHVMRRLVKRYNAGSNTVPMTTLAKWIQDKDPRAKEALLAEMKERPIIYSRAPTWHKFGVMGAWPVLREDDDTLSISPLVTKGFGADFDGDTMNFHVPASDKAVKEVIEKMMPSKNLLAEADFEPSYLPQQEFLLGLYKASRKAGKQEPHKFASKQDAIKAFLTGNLAVDAPIKIV